MLPYLLPSLRDRAIRRYGLHHSSRDRASRRDGNHRVPAPRHRHKEGYDCSAGFLTDDLFVDDLFGGDDEVSCTPGQFKVFYDVGIDLAVAVDITAVDVDKGTIGIGGRDEDNGVARERVLDSLAGTVLEGIGTEKGAGRDEGEAHHAGEESPLVAGVTDLCGDGALSGLHHPSAMPGRDLSSHDRRNRQVLPCLHILNRRGDRGHGRQSYLPWRDFVSSA